MQCIVVVKYLCAVMHNSTDYSITLYCSSYRVKLGCNGRNTWNVGSRYLYRNVFTLAVVN